MPTPDLSLITYCRDDSISSRWVGINALLSELQCDQNIYTLATATQWLLDNYTATVSLSSVSQPSPSTLLFTFSDASTHGPFDLPIAVFTDAGDWAIDTPYLVNDTFNAPNGGLYRVLFAHTSSHTSFDPAANDGLGHDYYAAMIPPRGNTIPAGGAVAMYFRKNSTTDYDANWAFISATEVDFSPSSDSSLSSNNVAAAIEELELLISGGPGALSGLSDVNVTEGPGIDGYFLTWDDGSGKWVAAASSSNLSGLADVNINEGPAIDGYFLQWNDGASKWEAAAASANLAGLTDVNVTEGSGIDGEFLKWNNGTSKWIASTVSLSGLADVNVTEGSGINGYFLKWDNGTSKWVASLSGATAVALSGLSDVNVTEGAGIDGQVLYWDNGGGKWQSKSVQPLDSDLTALASNSTNGIWARTGTGTGSARTITNGTGISVSNGDGVAGNPTISVTSAISTGSIEVVIDGGGSAITTGLKGYLSLPIAGTITEAKLLADQSGSIVVDVFKCTYSQFDAGSTHPVSGDKITASAPPTITTATKSQDTTLTGWTTAFSAGDILAFNVNSATTITRVTLSLKYTK